MEFVLLVASLVVAIGAIAAFGKYSSSKRERQAPTRSTELSTAHRAEITDLVNRGQKIQAIKMLRSATGMNLVDAKQAIDTWDPHRHDNFAPEPATSSNPRHSLPANVVAEIDTLISEGKNIKAIKTLRGETGLGLAEAKQAIDTWTSA